VDREKAYLRIARQNKHQQQHQVTMFRQALCARTNATTSILRSATASRNTTNTSSSVSFLKKKMSNTRRHEFSIKAASSSDGGEQTARDMIDLRVGKVTKCTVHPDADKLYVEEIDLQEPEGPRTICSGLVPYMKEEDILGKNVIVVANLKARNMQGIKSHGMLLAASNETHDKVELLVAPENAKLGSRVVFGDAAFNGEPASANQVQKKKYWEAFGPELVTNGEMEASWKEDGAVMRVELEGEEGEEAPSYGTVKCQSLANALVG
jgi:methionine--tRNA ligase beta chain